MHRQERHARVPLHVVRVAPQGGAVEEPLQAPARLLLVVLGGGADQRVHVLLAVLVVSRVRPLEVLAEPDRVEQGADERDDRRSRAGLRGRFMKVEAALLRLRAGPLPAPVRGALRARAVLAEPGPGAQHRERVEELLEGGPRPPREQAPVDRFARRSRQGESLGGGEGGELVPRGLADPAHRGVHGAGEGDVVVGGEEEAQVGQEVLDLLPLVEAERADDPVADTGPDHRLLDQAGLVVRPVENRDLARGEGLGQRGDDPDHGLGLVPVVARPVIVDGRAFLVLGPELRRVLAGVLLDDPAGRPQDRPGRAVVPLQLDDAGVGVVLLEFEDVPDVGAAEAVDRLVRVPDAADVAVHRRERADQAVLGVVRVLVLVHEQVPAAARVAGADLGVLLEQGERLEDQVVEVETARLPEALLVLLVAHRDHARVGQDRLGRELLRRQRAVLRVADLRQDRARRELALVDLEVLHRAAQDRELVGGVEDLEPRREPRPRPLAAQDPEAEGVEGPQPRAGGVGAEQGRDALLHLAGRLVRERDRDGFLGDRAPARDQPGQAVRDHAGLSRAGARQDQQGAFRREDGFALGLVQALEDGFRVDHGLWRPGDGADEPPVYQVGGDGSADRSARAVSGRRVAPRHVRARLAAQRPMVRAGRIGARPQGRAPGQSEIRT